VGDNTDGEISAAAIHFQLKTFNTYLELLVSASSPTTWQTEKYCFVVSIIIVTITGEYQ